MHVFACASSYQGVGDTQAHSHGGQSTTLGVAPQVQTPISFKLPSVIGRLLSK